MRELIHATAAPRDEEAPGSGRRSAGRSLKNARNECRTIVFVDESGLSERPNRYRTWSPRGQTPVLQYHFNWKSLSAIAVAPGELIVEA